MEIIKRLSELKEITTLILKNLNSFNSNLNNNSEKFDIKSKKGAELYLNGYTIDEIHKSIVLKKLHINEATSIHKINYILEEGLLKEGQDYNYNGSKNYWFSSKSLNSLRGCI